MTNETQKSNPDEGKMEGTEHKQANTKKPTETVTDGNNSQEDTRTRALRILASHNIPFLTEEELQEALSVPDLSNPALGPTPLNLVLRKIEDRMKDDFPNSDTTTRRTSPLTTTENNFDRLLFAQDSIARSPIYTRYTDEKHVLRTHTSCMIPDILKERPFPDDRVIICPGICFRRDVVDKTHTGTPHQVDVWRIKKGGNKLERTDLIKLIETILKAVMGEDVVYRVNETSHPYTLHGVEIEAMHKGNWLEILEAGEVNPKVLEDAGLDPNEYSGLASGFGLDRLAMMVKELDDIRLLRSKDTRTQAQMRNLEKYKQVSKMPPMTRDISVVVDESLTVEDISEAIRKAVGSDKVPWLEEIKIMSETPYEQLPDVARQRLGAKEGQKNLLIRIVIRSLDKTLVKDEADDIRDTAYLAIHESDVKTLIKERK